jgi:iron-sulfur cluster assembly protein
MALDESKEGDEIFSQNGLTFMIEKTLFEDVKPVKVDFVETPRGAGYSITSSMKPADCGGGCCG